MLMRSPGRRGLVAVAVAAAVVGGSGCSGSSTAGESATASPPPFTSFEFDPANFVDPTTSTNEFHPLRPGTQWSGRGPPRSVDAKFRTLRSAP